MECIIIYNQMCTELVLKCRSVSVISIFGFFKLFNYRIVLTVKFPVLDATQTIKKCAVARMENEIVKWQN